MPTRASDLPQLSAFLRAGRMFALPIQLVELRVAKPRQVGTASVRAVEPKHDCVAGRSEKTQHPNL